MGVRIAVIDSGVHAEHPHVRGVAGGVAIREDGTLHDDYVDRLGHGTAVTAAIREKAPAAEILAIKVFWRSLSTDIATLVHAIDEAADRGAALINLSLGTSRMQHRELLEAAVGRACGRGRLIVAANDDARRTVAAGMPGTRRAGPGGLGLRARRLRHRVRRRPAHALDLALSARHPGVSRERNVNGVSFAVANATGFVARALESDAAGAGPQPPTARDSSRRWSRRVPPINRCHRVIG